MSKEEKQPRMYTRCGHIEELESEVQELERLRDGLRNQMEAVNGTVAAIIYRQTQQIASRIETKLQIISNLRSGQPSHGYGPIGEVSSEDAAGGYHKTSSH